MAGNDTNINVNVSTTGLDTAAKQAKVLRDNLEAAATAGSSVGSKTAGSNTLNTIKTQAQSTQENVNYGVQRSLRGTGAGARDFAQQAQGLGGLVHLYATFAANIYAASAAFNALSDAVNTSHLAQGLDQLGAQSGKNLGTLSKQLNEVTGGALTFKDAMVSVANASAVGLSNKQILQLGEVAKKASQALGFDMVDAVDRLTKGIGKNRPQLLDELGILVNANTIYTDYARSVGKSTAALTDFEKKQAFANAVLKQGLDKFSAIDIGTNPYVQIEASAKNLIQTGLTLINTVFNPLVTFLSESPTALATTMAGIAAILVKQALPAIGAFRENAAKAAQEAGQLAGRYNDIAVKGATGGILAAKALAEKAAESELTRLDEAEKKINSLRDTTKTITGTRAATILAKPVQDVTEQDLKYLDQRANKLAKNNLIAAQGYHDYAEAVVFAQSAEKSYAEAEAKRLAVTKEVNSLTTTTGQNRLIALRAERAAAFANVTDIVAQTTQTEGFFAAIKKGFTEINAIQAGKATIQLPAYDPKTGERLADDLTKVVERSKGFNGALEAVGGAGKKVGVVFTAATGAISTALNAFQPWLVVIGLVVAAFDLLDSKLTNNAKEQQDYNNALETTISNTKLVNDVLRSISKAGFSKGLDVSEIKARSTALLEVADSASKLQDTFELTTKAASGWDSFWDSVKGVFGKGNVDKLAKGISSSLTDSIALVQDDNARATLKKKIQNIVGSTDFSYDNINKIFSKLGIDGANAMARALSETLASSGKDVGIAVSKLTEAQDGFKTVEKSFEALQNSLKDKAAISQFAETMIEQSGKIAEALKDPENALATFNALLAHPEQQKFFSLDNLKKIEDQSSEIITLTHQYSELNKAIQAGEEAQSNIASTPQNIVTPGFNNKVTVIPNQAYTDLQDLISKGTSAKGIILTVDANIDKLKNTLKDIFKDPLKLGLDLITQPLTEAITKAGLTTLSSAASGLAGEGSAALQAEIKNQQLEADKKNIEAMYILTNAIEANTLGLELYRLQQAKDSESNPTVRKSYDPQIKELTEQLGFLQKGIAGAVASYKDLSDVGKKAQFNSYQRALGGQAKEVTINANEQVNKDQGARAEAILTFNQSQKILQNEIDINALRVTRLKLASTTSGVENQTLSAIARNTEDQLLAQKQAKEDKAAEFKITQQEAALALVAARGGDVKKAQGSVNNAKQDKVLLDAQHAQQTSDQASKNQLELINEYYGIQQKVADLAAKASQNQFDLATARNDASKQELANATTLGGVTATYGAARLADLDLVAQKQKYILDQQQNAAAYLADINNAGKQKSTAINALPTTGDNSAEKASIEATYATEVAIANDQLNARSTLIDQNNTNATRSIELIKQQSVQQAKLNDLTLTLADVFGTVGSALGNVVTAMDATAKAIQLAADNTATLAKAKDAAVEADKNDHSEINAQKRIEATNAYTDAVNNQTDVQLAGYAKDAGAVSQLFGKKTQAYKAFAAVEKAISLIRLGLMIKEAAVDTITTGTKIANSIAKAGASAIEAIAGAFAAPFPIDFIAGAAMIAIMAAIVGGVGGRKSSAPAKGFSAADAQKVQNTGTAYDSKGNTIETGGGVLGSPAEQMDSIGKAIVDLNSTTVQGLDFDKTMVNLLTSIDRGINKAAAGLVNIPGLRTGSAFGTVESTNTNGGGFFKSPLGTILGSSFITSLSGNKETTSLQIADTGIKLAGTLLQLASGVGKLQQYENDILTTKKSSFFGLVSSTNTSTQTNYADIGAGQLKDFFTQVFSDSVSLLEELGASFGKTKDSIDSILATIPVDAAASLKGLTGDDFTKALEGLINQVLDTSTRAIFGSVVSLYQKMGETALETLVRVVDDNNKVNLALQSIGHATIDSIITAQDAVGTSLETIKNQSIAVTEALVEGAGGLDKFLSQVSSYSKNFLTDAERLAPIQTAVQDQLTALGYSGVTTRDQFKNIVSGLDLTTASGRATYQSLMNIADSFAQVYPAVEKSMSAEDFRVKTLNNEISIQKALGNQYQAIQMQREEELYQLSLYPAAQSAVLILQQKTLYALQDANAMYNQQVEILKAEGKTAESTALQRQLELNAMDDRLRPGQEYINALNDEADIVSRLTTARDAEASALNTTIDGLKSYIDNLNKYKTSLQLGSSSILTEQQKYQAAKDQLMQLQATANGPANTPEQIAAQKAALDGLSGAADAFLQSSQSLYASSDQYASDYQSVMQILDTTTASLSTQESDAQLQLDQLTASTSFLDNIATATETTAQILTEYYAQQGVIAAAQASLPVSLDTSDVSAALQAIADSISATADSGYIAQDVSAGLIINNQNINTAVLNDQLITLQNQVISLQNEIIGLRADQAAQTDAIIATNVAASNNVAETVAETGFNSSNEQLWSERSRPVYM